MQPRSPGKRLPLTVSLALVLLTLSAGLTQAQDRLPNCYVLSAGVDNYKNANRLNGCLNDARNTTAAFKAQQGAVFGNVYSETLLDATATRGSIMQKFQKLANQGGPGDYVVLFLSGHGARTNGNKTWYFLPYDYQPGNMAGTIVTDRFILDVADGMIQNGRKVFVIVDACFAGQMRTTAQVYFNKYNDPQGGGLVLMLSSSANQTSAALGDFSAFAKAFADSMTASGDLNRDGRITLQEIRQYSYQRTYQLLKQRGMKDKQDSLVAWSPSISENLVVAATKQVAVLPEVKPPIPVEQGTGPWVGSENLSGFGKLSFTMNPGGKAVMVDAKERSEGTWQQKGKQFTLRFYGGRVVYTGTLNGSTLSGTANNGKSNWTWTVQTQWSGSETLDGYGKLSFTMSPGGQAVMEDAKERSDGTWQQNGKLFTLRFYEGRVVYTGMLNGSVLSGTANNGKSNWNWTVQAQSTN